MIISNLQDISALEYKKIFDDIIDGNLTDNEIKDFLIELNKNTFQANAFLGAIWSFRPRCKQLNIKGNILDVCGTGGDGLNTLNISTAVALVVASCGVKVAKHGNRAISSKSGSADVLSELGINIMSQPYDIEQSFKKNNFCFIFAPLYHPAFKNIAKIRQELSIPTIFNFLGPLLNPAKTNYQLIGTSKKETMRPMLEALQAVGSKKVFIVHGLDGMDEATICDDFLLQKLEDGKISDLEVVNPEDFGIKKVSHDKIKGGDASYNAKKLKLLLAGEKSPYRDIVALNSALALVVVGQVDNIKDGMEMVCNAVNSEKVKNILG